MATSFDLPQRSTIVNNCDNVIAEEQVVLMTIGGDPIDQWESPDTTYHFTIYLVLSKNCSVHLNMLPDYENQQIGTVTIASLSSNFSSEPNAIRFDTQPRPGATVASLVNLWMNKGRDQYRFDSNGEGCRTWCRALLSDAEESELVISGSMDAFRNFEQEMRALKGPYRIPIPCAVGTFY